jgi:hypothetical protein
MLIKLTSANPEIKDSAIYLSSDKIVSIYRGEKKSSSDVLDVTEEITYVFCPPHGTWEVQETPEEIITLING